MITYDLAKRGERPLYEYLYESIKNDIISNVLHAGERMPSKRKLAQHLAVSLITVEGAYSQLIAEGYIRSIERRGYYVNDIAQLRDVRKRHEHDSVGVPRESYALDSSIDQDHQQKSALRLKHPIDMERERASKSVDIDLSGRAPSKGLFPYDRWAFHVRKVLTNADEKVLVSESGAFGSRALRKAIARFLLGYRGMEVNPDNVVIGAGSQVLYQLIVQLIGRGHRYALEDPGYGRLARIYRANDVTIAPIPLNEDGIELDSLRSSGASVAHVMPTHQYPTGQIMSISRRYELLAWAAGDDERFIIEDDHDSELQFSGRPIPSLQSIDAQQKVIYLNTFTKSLGPAFRMSYMVLPDVLAQKFREHFGFYSCTANAIDQLALARFIESGEYERHINRLRTHFRANATELARAMRQEKLTDLVLENAFAGSHGLLRVDGPVSARELADAALEEGLLIEPLEDFLIGRADALDLSRSDYLDSRLFIDHGALSESNIGNCASSIARAYQCCS
nr:PLP-dependent aminotransferase family protein [Anaerotardibacter muris]